MAIIANTMFEVKCSNSVYDELANITGLFQAQSANADCPAGFLCVRGANLGAEGYTGVKNTNAYIMNAAGATDFDGIYACNTFDVETGNANGHVYKIGSETLGLHIPAGMRGTFTRIYFDNDKIYRFGIGNLSAAIDTKKYFTIANGLLVPAAAAPKAGTPYFKLIDSAVATVGSWAGMTVYDVMACRDVNVAAA